MQVGIVGTAGRGINYDRDMFDKMVSCARDLITNVCVVGTSVTSGGSSFSDHVAIRLFLDGDVKTLTLYLPVLWCHESCKFMPTHEGITLNNLHHRFSTLTGYDSLSEINEAITRGATVVIIKGFKNRNTGIAKDTSGDNGMLLAFNTTDGTPITPGTLDTWRKHSGHKISINIYKL